MLRQNYLLLCVKLFLHCKSHIDNLVVFKLRCKSAHFQNLFLPFIITGWNKSDSDFKNIDFKAMSCKKLLTFIITSLENDTYGIYDPLGVKLLNRLRLGFSHKFRHNFADTLNPLCSCSLETEDTEHYFLRSQNNASFRTTFVNNLNNINTAIASLNPKLPPKSNLCR